MPQMAPILSRQFHYSPPPPQPPKHSPATPVPVSKFISARVLLDLFIGTVCIFFIGVLFWKIGKFLRFLTRSKVLREGNTTTTRYARTWYGWVSLQRHEANKELFRRCFRKLREWTSWRSSRADYRWVWWDPGDKELQIYQQRRRKQLRWLPKCLRSYPFTTADTMWNPRTPPGHNTAQNKGAPDHFSAVTGKLESQDGLGHMSTRHHRLLPIIYTDGSVYDQEEIRYDYPSATFVRRRPFYTDNLVLDQSLIGPGDFWTQSSTQLVDKTRLFLSLNEPKRLSRGSLFLLPLATPKPHLKTCSLTSLLDGMAHLPRPREASYGTERTRSNIGSERSTATRKAHRHSRKYQIWSARMQMQTSMLAKPWKPPGSPIPELIATYSSEQSSFIGSVNSFERTSVGYCYSNRNSQVLSIPGLRSTQEIKQVENQTNKFRYKGIYGSRSSCEATQSNRPPQRTRQCAGGGAKGKSPIRKNNKHKDRRKKPASFEKWSNWEVQMIDCLDRKLEWLFGQLNSGRRPFHFAILANHWLNRETWYVIDPISRVSMDARRQQGDPRFNTPYPVPSWGPKPKYPEDSRKRAHTPRIGSWRVAVNQNRRISGVSGTLKSIQLYEGSAEDTPDGKVDPASWLLRKPPQGYSMSTKQKNAYYEGGAGWQEKLADWQSVRYGYRIRKAIYEGRANRTRVKKLAADIARVYQAAPSRIPNISQLNQAAH